MKFPRIVCIPHEAAISDSGSDMSLKHIKKSYLEVRRKKDFFTPDEIYHRRRLEKNHFSLSRRIKITHKTNQISG